MSLQIAALLAGLLLAGCGGQPLRPPAGRSGPAESAAAPATLKAEPGKPFATVPRRGGYYLDDGPGDTLPPDLESIPDAVPRAEPLHRFANNPYSVLGRDYVPLREASHYRATGIGSWYGRKFHGQKTSSGEAYDMYGMSAAHPTLPIPSYVRVTNPANGKSVVVRVNDRGPFHAGRLIDLSYTAAWRLDYIGNGSTRVIVESIAPGQAMLAARPADSTPARETPRPARAVVLPTVAGEGGHYVQLGAFGNRDNAEALQARLARELGDLADKLVVRSAGSLHRVQLGPWADPDAAQLVAQTLRDSLELAPVVIQR